MFNRNNIIRYLYRKLSVWFSLVLYCTIAYIQSCEHSFFIGGYLFHIFNKISDVCMVVFVEVLTYAVNTSILFATFQLIDPLWEN